MYVLRMYEYKTKPTRLGKSLGFECFSQDSVKDLNYVFFGT